jgi:hypothetical protein
MCMAGGPSPRYSPTHPHNATPNTVPKDESYHLLGHLRQFLRKNALGGAPCQRLKAWEKVDTSV